MQYASVGSRPAYFWTSCCDTPDKKCFWWRQDYVRYANTCYGGSDYPTVKVSVDLIEGTSVLLQTASNGLW